ncbi:unnamed protein product [Thlaspi arvense]|uniref:Uncharacterized protein n=1 Tax=Thlaspi arvense TaxID=13288 RepID=A0AAU9R711_THLAR|nr:unnamed protein product [Thlaspi arvense]
MALKRGLSGVHRIKGGGGESRSVLVLLVFFCVFAPLVFFVGRGVYIDSSNKSSLSDSVLTIFLPLQVLDVITISTADLGPFSLDSFKKNNLSASWRGTEILLRDYLSHRHS